jgi:hypothetical protein
MSILREVRVKRSRFSDTIGSLRGMGDFGWAIGIGILVICATVGRSVAALLRAKAGQIDRSRPDADAEGLHVGEGIEDLRRRVGELEEREDFTERLLSKPREAERVAPPPPAG